MAEILLARVTGIEEFSKYVVLKRILPSYTDEPAFVQMFLDEARLAAQLHHQNIAQVYAIGSEHDSYFFSMEYLHGVDVRHLVRKLEERDEQLPIHHAIFIAAQAAAGLHYAHEKRDERGRPLGIVHRDVSSSNVFLTYEGGVKVVDFGIAWAARRSQETQGSGLKGTVLYMSPEQTQGATVDRRSDIYAVGVILYELVVGARPFGGGGMGVPDILESIVQGRFVRPIERQPSVPEPLNDIICKAMSRLPEDRYPTGEELIADLETFALSQSLPQSSRHLKDYLVRVVGYEPEPWLDLQLAATELLNVSPDARAIFTQSVSLSLPAGGTVNLRPPNKAPLMQADAAAQAEPAAAAPSPSPAPSPVAASGTSGMSFEMPEAQTAVVSAPHPIHEAQPVSRSRAAWPLRLTVGVVFGVVCAAIILLLNRADEGADQEPVAPAAAEPATAKAAVDVAAEEAAAESAAEVQDSREGEQARALSEEESSAEDIETVEPASAKSGASDAPADTAEASTDDASEQKAVESVSASASTTSKSAKARSRNGQKAKRGTKSRTKTKTKTKPQTKTEPSSDDEKERWTKDSLFLPSGSR